MKKVKYLGFSREVLTERQDLSLPRHIYTYIPPCILAYRLGLGIINQAFPHVSIDSWPSPSIGDLILQERPFNRSGAIAFLVCSGLWGLFTEIQDILGFG
jgi:hypothetical protein